MPQQGDLDSSGGRSVLSLAELEDIRKKVLLYSRGLLLLGWVLILLSLGGGWWKLLLPIGILLIGLAQLQLRALRMGLKVALVAPLAEAMGFRYSPGQGFPQEEALASGLFSPPDAYAAEDLVEGEVSGIPFTSSDIALYRKVKVKTNNVSTDQYQEFFRGTLYRFHLPFPVEGEVRFGPRGRGIEVMDWRLLRLEIILIAISFVFTVLLIFGKAFDFWGRLFWYAFWPFFIYMFYITHRPNREKKQLERVVLESPEFERFYNAYGDQVEARKLLTPRVQEALVRLRKYLGRPIWGAVRGKELWLLVEGKDRFLVPINRPVSEVFEMEKARYQEELLEVSRVVEALRLEEEAKRKGVWQEKALVGQNEPPSVSEKESNTLDGDEAQEGDESQQEDAPRRRSRFFGK
jgi:hypothetical protein